MSKKTNCLTTWKGPGYAAARNPNTGNDILNQITAQGTGRTIGVSNEIVKEKGRPETEKATKTKPPKRRISTLSENATKKNNRATM
jgi:hypothetical protein